MVNSERLLERFLRYVQVDTTADESSSEYPSSPGQRTLGAMIADELRGLRLENVEHDANGLVWATVPGNVEAAPTVAFNAHLDTSPETSGTNVRPQVIRDYGGGDLVLPGDSSQVIRVAENPELNDLVGRTLITTDGTTLLGADDKAGVAVIVELAAVLMENPDLPHGPVRILFTCDEEIGRGVDHVDIAKVGAVACYTLDGAGADDVDVETFSADQATVTVRGANIHPSIAKDRMVNALRAAGMFLDRLPRRELSPETTADRQGFIHPYHVEGGVAEATIKLILRDFDTAELAVHAERLRSLAKEVETASPGIRIDVATRPQYRNLGDGLAQEPRAVAYAVEAHQRLGREAKRTIVRGGTDGSLLTERGLPTPNLSTGQHNPHSPLEWACLDEMVLAARVLVQLVQVWCETSSD
ncbi:MAG: peptidase T [Planctomycetales bacterium]|nr:peptidase T [Planctomycetales bacterium]